MFLIIHVITHLDLQLLERMQVNIEPRKKHLESIPKSKY